MEHTWARWEKRQYVKQIKQNSWRNKEHPGAKQQQQGTLNVKNPNNDHRGDF
jgi:hypothetical protein